MIKKIDSVLNWILVALFIALACCGCIAIPALAFSFVLVFIGGIVVRMVMNKKNNSNIIEFKRKD